MYHFIYKTTNLVNGKIYIGKHSSKTLDDNYLGSGVVLQKAILKYGRENFKREILELFDTSDEALIRESEIVTKEFINRPDVYNAKPGGKGGWHITEISQETRDKIGNIHRGRIRTQPERDAISRGRKGVTSDKLKAHCSKLKLLNRRECWDYYDEILDIWKQNPQCWTTFTKTISDLGYEVTQKVIFNMIERFISETGIQPIPLIKRTSKDVKAKVKRLIPEYYPISAPDLHDILKEKDIDISINVLRTLIKDHKSILSIE